MSPVSSIKSCWFEPSDATVVASTWFKSTLNSFYSQAINRWASMRVWFPACLPACRWPACPHAVFLFLHVFVCSHVCVTAGKPANVVLLACMHASLHASLHTSIPARKLAYLYGCMPACLHACVFACLRVCMRACSHACIPAWLHACMHACMQACLLARQHACLHACMPACMHARSPTCVLFWELMKIVTLHTHTPCILQMLNHWILFARCSDKGLLQSI